MAGYERNRQLIAIRARCLLELRSRHYDEFEKIYTEELKKAGIVRANGHINVKSSDVTPEIKELIYTYYDKKISGPKIQLKLAINNGVELSLYHIYKCLNERNK